MQSQHDESLFFSDIQENAVTKQFLDPLKNYSAVKSIQVYVLSKPQGVQKNFLNDTGRVAIILIPKHSITLLNYGELPEDDFFEYKLDFQDDLDYLAKTYNYTQILGRSRRWPEELITRYSLCDFNADELVENLIAPEYNRFIDLLISLLIGSINDVDRLGINEPATLLEKVKQKIILFDGKQSRFIYESPAAKRITIQGMAGTGKTELLLHKLKDIYTTDDEAIIAFTCFNKVLANDTRKRIPQFFNFMKITKQIAWEERLFVFSSWGSLYDPHSGLYRYVCSQYDLEFTNYGQNPNFDRLCKQAIMEIKERVNFQPCFDYIFIDESQDFKESFIELCELVTRKIVFVAGDIFQNIFDTSINTEVTPDYLLNKCYRTDPKTLMFAHAVGMGLYETPQINWLTDDAWVACGYSLTREEESRRVQLTRKPLRRFEDLDAIDTICLSKCGDNDYSSSVLSCIENIRAQYSDVEPQDIAVVILGSYKKLCEIADIVDYSIQFNYGWNSVKGYETKNKKENRVYISNVNNIKGLEFPFVICVVPQFITQNVKDRNAIYMTLTRSFLTSFFVVDENNDIFFDTYSEAAKDIKQYGHMALIEPTHEEIEAMVDRIQISLAAKKESPETIVTELLLSEYPKLQNEQHKNAVSFLLSTLPSNLTKEQIAERVRTSLGSLMSE